LEQRIGERLEEIRSRKKLKSDPPLK